MRETPIETPDPQAGGFALNQDDIEEFKGIISKEFGVEMSNRDAWNRVIELLNLYRALIGPIPEDPNLNSAQSGLRTSSHLLSRRPS